MKDIFREYGAKAIWKDTQQLENRYLRFQTTFEGKRGEATKFYIAADTNFEFYLNGELIGFGQYHDYPTEKNYNEYDITSAVREGENLISILAFSQGEVSGQEIPGIPMVIFLAVANEKCLVKSDDTTKCDVAKEYQSGKMERISCERSWSCGFDLRKDDLWKENYVSDNWGHAVICDDRNVTYKKRPLKNLALGEVLQGEIIACGLFEESGNTNTEEDFIPTKYEEEKNTPSAMMQYAKLAFRDKETLIKENNGTIDVLRDNVYYIADIKEETAGYFTLDVLAEEGAVIDFVIGEHLSDMRVRSWVVGRNYAMRTICRGGRQKLTFCIKRWAGRYIQVFLHKGVKTIYQAGILKTWYPIDFFCKIDTKDRLFNKIFEVSQRTLHLCMHEHYEDSPQREQSLYGMDGRNQMLAGYYAFGETAMPKESLRLLAKGRKENGLLEITAPSYYERTIPSFCLAFVCAVRDYGLFSGDIAFLKEMFPCIKGIMDFFELDETINLIPRPIGYEYWNFYEWTDGMIQWNDSQEVNYDAPLNAFYSFALKNYGDILDWIGGAECQEEYQRIMEKRQRIVNAFHSVFYWEKEEAYCTVANKEIPHFAQLTQAWALLGDCVPISHRKKIRKAVIREDFVNVSLSHSVFKYDVLMEEPEQYRNFVLDDIERQWGRMLYQGATSFWEGNGGADEHGRAASLCHGWSATPTYLFYRYLLGIYPTEPGFKTLKIDPVMHKEGTEGVLKTPSGIFKIESNGEIVKMDL